MADVGQQMSLRHRISQEIASEDFLLVLYLHSEALAGTALPDMVHLCKSASSN
eukprot:CAMPEP_0181541402 /NCGR_PEP_ID=MMETSP1110-20121109/77384_1 /TAXON_ID=174948 /ORGANISM="Symbiodinium sp., Strain CCMP421" /LENGTH=52 /DNA_ID=CAMNT_0023673075 /DNA_START=316 /DNA_END=474 /DNA_ORIENTATION=+